MGSPARHSSGRKVALRPVRRDRSAKTHRSKATEKRRPDTDWKGTVSAMRDELSVVHATAAVVQRSLTADDGDKHAATTLLERVCYPLAEMISRLDRLFAAVHP